MNFNHREAMRYLGAKPEDVEAGILVDTVYLKLRNEVRARHVVKRFGCSVEEDGVLLDCGVRFRSRMLARHLRGCTELLLLGATLGLQVDTAIRRLSLLSVAEGAAAQAVAAALIEEYCDQVQRGLDVGELYQQPRFSPGYGDWPLEEQEELLTLLDSAKSIGLTLTEGYMLVPAKSVTAVIGLSRQSCHPKTGCAACDKLDCAFRCKEDEVQ